MKLHVNIDEKLIEKALKLHKNKTKKAIVQLALENLIKSSMRKQMLELKGKVKWVGNLGEMRM